MICIYLGLISLLSNIYTKSTTHTHTRTDIHTHTHTCIYSVYNYKEYVYEHVMAAPTYIL